MGQFTFIAKISFGLHRWQGASYMYHIECIFDVPRVINT